MIIPELLNLNLIWLKVDRRRLLEIALELGLIRQQLRLIWEVQWGLSVRRVMVMDLIVKQKLLVRVSLHIAELKGDLVSHINKFTLLLERWLYQR
jgi:hypothetical protein